MKIGFIGAGKVGCSLGKYFAVNGMDVSGYFSKNPESAATAAKFTGTKHFETVQCVAEDSDILFITVPDMEIPHVWEQLKLLPIQQKIICHCSGSLSAAIFSEIDQTGASGYSIHPLFAISSKFESYKELSKALFTIEGSKTQLLQMTQLFENCGSRVQVISGEHKTKYHAAAATASNLVVGLIAFAQNMLMECGFEEEAAKEALTPLIRGNVEHVLNDGLAAALTGPIERNDVETVRKHLACMGEEQRVIYQALSQQVVKVAKTKHEEVDYSMLEEVLQ